MLPESVKRLPVTELSHQWWLDSEFRGGVAKRVGWWTVEGKYRMHWYIVVFTDGTRSETRRGTNPVEEV